MADLHLVPTAHDGHKLFVEMMEELGQYDNERDDHAWQKEDGAIIHRYMAIARERGEAVSQGFFAALTDCLCYWQTGTVPLSHWLKEASHG